MLTLYGAYRFYFFSLPDVQSKEFITRKLIIEKIERRYFLSVPESYNPTKKYKLILGFHGGFSNGLGFDKRTHLSGYLKDQDVIYVLPEGLQRFWADKSGSPRENEKNRDVEFVKSIIEHISGAYSVDTSHIYAAGFSRGANFVFRLACEIPNMITGIMTVGASLPIGLQENCELSHGVSLLLIHGTADPISHFEGGKMGSHIIRIPSGETLGVEKTLSLWAKKLRCGKARSAVVNQVQKISYAGCHDQSLVESYIVKGMGHTWPPYARSTWLYGETSTELEANKIILDFIRR